MPKVRKPTHSGSWYDNNCECLLHYAPVTISARLLLPISSSRPSSYCVSLYLLLADAKLKAQIGSWMQDVQPEPGAHAQAIIAP
eukprot:1160622-Pelagomonas_calceolata.AAC.3